MEVATKAKPPSIIKEFYSNNRISKRIYKLIILLKSGTR